MIAITGVPESLASTLPGVDYEHEHRDAEHEHEEMPEHSDADEGLDWAFLTCETKRGPFT